MSLTLPPPRVALASWPDDMPEKWQRVAAQAKHIARNAGSGRRADELHGPVRRLLEERRTDELLTRMGDRVFARVVVALWAEEPRLAQRSMTPKLVRAVVERSEGRPVGRPTAITLASLFLEHYDRLDDWHEGLFEATAVTVDVAAHRSRPRAHRDLLEVLRDLRRYVVDPEGPRSFAHHLVTSGTTPEKDPDARALCGDNSGRYAQVLRNTFYLELIASADHSAEGHWFLADATARATALRRDEDDRRFGITVLSALCDKGDTAVPSTEWVDAVLAIGGDPRHEQSSTWRDWWAHVDEPLRARAVRWMSGADLRAFLRAVRVYGDETRNESLQRMFPRRERFLMGLYETGHVRATRLILGNDVRRTMRRVTNINLVDAPRFDDMNTDAAIVFVDCGDFHLVEGSHKFKLHLYLGRPGPELTDPRRRAYTREELIHVIPDAHKSRHPLGDGAHDAWTHDQGGAWLRKALDFLRERGITIDETALVDKHDMEDLVRRRSGLAPLRRSPSRAAWRRR